MDPSELYYRLIATASGCSLSDLNQSFEDNWSDYVYRLIMGRSKHEVESGPIFLRGANAAGCWRQRGKSRISLDVRTSMGRAAGMSGMILDEYVKLTSEKLEMQRWLQTPWSQMLPQQRKIIEEFERKMGNYVAW